MSQHWFTYWFGAVRHYLNQCWLNFMMPYTVFKITSESCRSEAQFCQNLYMIKKESLPDQPKFCWSGSAVRHLFWRLHITSLGYNELSHQKIVVSVLHQSNVTFEWLVACSMPNHHLNLRWLIVNWNPRNTMSHFNEIWSVTCIKKKKKNKSSKSMGHRWLNFLI